MHRIAALAVAFCAAAGVAVAASVTDQNVTFPTGTENIAGYLAAPDSPGRHPAVIVLHEEWGLTEWVKEQTRQLAAQGYVALAEDMFRGQMAHDPQVAYELMVGTPPERALRDMRAAIAFFELRADVNKDKIGVVGWSAGGRWALLLAAYDPLLAACVTSYGAMPTDSGEIQRIHAPVLGLFGADDPTVRAGDVEAFVSAMNHAHKSIEIKMYRGDGHGFENPDNKLSYHEGDADDAWQRTLAFLNEHLK